MGSCFRGRAIREWRKRTLGDQFHWRFLVSLVIAGLLVAAISLLVTERRPESAETQTMQDDTPTDWEARLAEQAEVAAESRQALQLLRRELEQLREDYQTLQARHEAQSRELEETREQLQSLRAQGE